MSGPAGECCYQTAARIDGTSVETEQATSRQHSQENGGGKCPFNHSTKLPSSTPTATVIATPADAAACPEDHSTRATGSTRTGHCPFDHKAAGAAGRADDKAEGAGRSPVNHTSSAQSDALSGRDDKSRGAGKCPVNHASRAAAGALKGKCPVAHSGSQAKGTEAGDSNGSAGKAVCPFGYSSDKQSLSELHCPRCRSLFHDCVMTHCGHRFCRGCIDASPECLQCGDTLGDTSPDADTQGLVEAFIATHSTDAGILAGNITTPIHNGDEKDQDATKAAFLLELGLRSMLGGNGTAARERLEACRRLLIAAQDSRGPSAELSAQLGAVCGAQGDCALSFGDMSAAAECYNASIGHLEECKTGCLEVQQALTVTLNKLGDMWYRASDLEAAKQHYCKALDIRRRLASAGTGNGKALRAQLDFALSLAKVADIEQALGGRAPAQQCLDEAKAVAARLEDEKQALDAASSKRLEALSVFLQQWQQS